MLARMEQEDEDGYNELDDMVDGLFDLYGMVASSNTCPADGNQLTGSTTHLHEPPSRSLVPRTYRTGPGELNLHRLQGIDFPGR